jgi:hypothetical protein
MYTPLRFVRFRRCSPLAQPMVLVTEDSISLFYVRCCVLSSLLVSFLSIRCSTHRFAIRRSLIESTGRCGNREERDLGSNKVKQTHLAGKSLRKRWTLQSTPGIGKVLVSSKLGATCTAILISLEFTKAPA